MLSKTQPRFFSTKKRRKTITERLGKPSLSETQQTQTLLQETETAICGICFNDDDHYNTTEAAEVIDWISCTECDMWVHKTCAMKTNDGQTSNNCGHSSSDFIYMCPYCL